MRALWPLLALGLLSWSARAQHDDVAPLPEPPPLEEEPASDSDDTKVYEPSSVAPLTAPDPSLDAAPTSSDPAADVLQPAAREVTLRFSAEADAKLARCVPLVAARKDEEARACLDEVLEHGDDTTASLRAAALRSVLDVAVAVPGPADVTTDGDAAAGGAREAGFAIPPGRLELSSTAGLFGVWNGIAAGIAVAPHLPPANPAGLILGTGALAVGLGVGYGVGGYFLAEALDLGEGGSRLVASSLLWGTTFGIASLPALLDVVRPSDELGLSLSLGTIVASGFAVGGGALALASFTELSPAQVSLINTGGWVGGLFGLLTVASLAPFTPPLPAYSAGYLTVASGGLLAGALAGLFVDLSWGETLLLDLGGVLGTVTAAAIVMSLTASGALNAVPSTVLIPVNSLATAGGTLGGIGLGLAATTLFRGEAGSIFKTLGADVVVLPPAPALVVDKDGNAAPMFLAPTLIF